MKQHAKDVKSWSLHRGKNELIRYLEGGRLTLRQAIIAKCYDCCGGYPEGAFDCGCRQCPLHDFMPYRTGGARKIRIIKKATVASDEK